MGLLDIIRGNRLPIDDPVSVPIQWKGDWFEHVMGYSIEKLWKTQPSLRTVVSFRARNVAQLGVHVFQRVTDEDRRRLTDDPLAQLISRPSPTTTTYELLYDLVSTLDLYDIAYWYVVDGADTPSGWIIRRIPAPWVTGTVGGNHWEVDGYVVQPPGKPAFTVDAKHMIVFHGWHPESETHGETPIEALRQTLAEQMNAAEYRLQVWQRGGRAGTVVSRPADAPNWSDTARLRFMNALRDRFTGSAKTAGGPLLLEDGMTMEQPGFSAKENQYVDAAKLSVSTVASVYHVNPTMIGQLDNANFSNVREFRSMLYTETLGPLLRQITDRLNAFLVPRVTTTSGAYVEFNIAEKLRGSFEEQASVLSTAIGRPWMTADEGRGRNNLPALGGDAAQLVTPLNVLVGGQASPQDGGAASGTQSAPRPGAKAPTRLLLKRRASTEQVKSLRAVFTAFFERQSRAVLSSLGAKADGDWWDEERWIKELSDDLLAKGQPLTVATARRTLEAAGLDPDEYDVERTVNYLKAVAKNTATAVNRTTKADLDAALDAEDPDEALANVYAVAADARADQSGQTLATALASFATVEAVHQVGGDGATKTWIVTSGKPRPSHAAMNGETVGIDDSFSNGAAWPGDSSALDVDDIAGCTCDVSIDIP